MFSNRNNFLFYCIVIEYVSWILQFNLSFSGFSKCKLKSYNIQKCVNMNEENNEKKALSFIGTQDCILRKFPQLYFTTLSLRHQFFRFLVSLLRFMNFSIFFTLFSFQKTIFLWAYLQDSGYWYLIRSLILVGNWSNSSFVFSF